MTAAALPIEVSELDGPEVDVLLTSHSIAKGADTEAILVSGSSQAIDLARTVIRLMASPDESAETFESVVAALTPPTIMSRGRLLQARLHAQRRQQIIQEFGLFSAADIAVNVGSTASNTAATATRWTKMGLIFAVETDGRNLGYPGFQFAPESPKPLPVIHDILGVLGDRLKSWALATWFTSNAGGLDDQRPVDLLQPDPDAVVAYAKYYVNGHAW